MPQSKRDKGSPTEAPDKKPDPKRREPLLELEQLDPLARDFIRINGVAYDLANRDSWGLSQRLKVKRLTERCDELEALAEPTPEEELEYVQRLRGLAQIVLPALPDEVLDALQPGQMSDIWLSFLANRLQKGKSSMAAVLAMMRGSRGVA